MYRLNTKLIVTLAVCSFLFLVGVFFLHRFQVSRSADTFLNRAQVLKDEGETSDAIRTLRAYLHHRPDDLEQYTTLALWSQEYVDELIADGKQLSPRVVGDTFNATERALLKNSKTDVHLCEESITFYMKIGRTSDAINYLEALIQDAGDEPKPDWLTKLALCYVRSGQDEKSEEVLNRLVGYDRLAEQFDIEKAENPGLIDSYVMLASIYENNRRNRDTARRVMDQMVTANPDKYDAYLRRARFIERTALDEPDKERAAVDLAKARELAPDEADVLLASAAYELRAKNYDAAKIHLDTCLKDHSDKERTFELLQNWATSQGNVEEALGYIKMGLEKNPNSETLSWSQANLLLQQGDLDAVEKALKRMEEKGYPSSFRDFLKARLLIAKQQWLKASRLLEKARPLIVVGQPRWIPTVDLNLALCYQRLGKSDMRLKSLRRVAEADIANMSARVGIIQSLLTLGQTDKAIREYDILEEQFGSISDAPIRWGPLRLQFEVLRQSRRPKEEQVWDRAEELASQLEADESFDAKMIARFKAQMLSAQGRTDEATAVLVNMQSEDDGGANARLMEINRLAKEEDVEAALKELNALVAESGDSVRLRIVRANLARRLPPLQGKSLLAQVEKGIDRFSKSEQFALYRVLGNAYLGLGEVADAQRSWRQASTIMPGNVDILISRFDLAQQTGDEFGMERVLTDIGDRVGRDSSEWKWAEATRHIWLARNGRGDGRSLLTARGLLDEAREVRPDWFVIPQTEAQIWLIEGDTEQAIVSLQKTLELGPPRRMVVRQLLRLLYQAGRLRETGRYLAMIDRSQWDLLEKRIDMELKSLDGEVPEDIPIAVDSDDPQDHMWAGRVQAKAGRLDEAEKSFRRAVKAGPMLDDGWRALVGVLVKQGKMVEAENATRSVELYFPAAQAAPVLASCYAIMKDFRQALHFYNMALENNPGDLRVLRELAQLYAGAGRFGKAKNYLERIISQSPPNAAFIDPNVSWARRLLAEVRAQTGTYEGYKDAVKLIEQNVPAGQPSRPAELALLGRLALSRPDGLSRRKAIEQFEKTQAARPLSEVELFSLAKLYHRNGRWIECKDTMGGVLSANSKNEEYLQTWLNWLLEKDEITLAQSWLQKLNQKSLFAIRVKAELLARQNRTKEVVQLVQTFIPPKNYPNYESQVLMVASLLEELAQNDKDLNAIAEKLWRRYVERRPDEMIRLARFLATQDDRPDVIAETFDVLKKSRGSSSSLDVHQVALQVLRRHRSELQSDSKYYGIVKSWIDEATRRLPDSKRLAMQRSELEDMRGDYDTVEILYRVFLQRSDLTQSERALVNNNLGYVLALKGNKKESLALVDEALSVIGPSADLLDTRAMIHLLGGDAKSAIADLKYAIEDGGENAFKLFHLAVAYMTSGDLDQARDAYDRAIAEGLDRRELNTLEQKQYDELLSRLDISTEQT